MKTLHLYLEPVDAGAERGAMTEWSLGRFARWSCFCTGNGLTTRSCHEQFDRSPCPRGAADFLPAVRVLGMKWQAKRNAAGQVVPRCWVTDSGYTVAECRVPHPRFPITRPGQAYPFAYASERDEVVRAIEQDMIANTDLMDSD